MAIYGGKIIDVYCLFLNLGIPNFFIFFKYFYITFFNELIKFKVYFKDLKNF